MKICLFVLGMIVLAGCGKEETRAWKHYELTGRGIEHAEITVNGEPAEDGGSVSFFITNGTNELRVQGEVSDHYEIHFGRTTSLFGKDWEPLWEVSDPTIEGTNVTLRLLAPNRPASFQHSFVAEVPSRWAWQDADPVGDLTEADKQEIGRIVNSFAIQFKNRSFSLSMFTDPATTIYWNRDPKVVEETTKGFREMLEKIGTYQDLTCETAPPKSWLSFGA